MSKPPPKRIPPHAKRRLMELIDLHLHVVGHECKYQPGWDDDKIASETGLTKWTVQNHRRQFYGDLIAEQRHKAGGSGPWANAMAKIEPRIEALEHAVTELTNEISRIRYELDNPNNNLRMVPK